MCEYAGTHNFTEDTEFSKVQVDIIFICIPFKLPFHDPPGKMNVGDDNYRILYSSNITLWQLWVIF